jgi:hypothetical protein
LFGEGGATDDNEDEEEEVRKGIRGRKKQAEIGCSIGQVMSDNAAWPFFTTLPLFFLVRFFYSLLKGVKSSAV